MPSQAFTNVLQPLLADVDDLVGAHETGRTKKRGRQWHLEGLNRSIVVMAVSAWESYVEHVVAEAVEAVKPVGGPLGSWPALRASVLAAKGRFNTPNPQNVRRLVSESVGLADITAAWGTTPAGVASNVQRLEETVNLRHRIAHGVHPRPTVRHPRAALLRGYLRPLAKWTDAGIRRHVKDELGVTLTW